ncbi:MAG: peptidylprolyl isomerase [Clostridia bacterium]|nr:peptidylprolyl isomerase [Clostridia bacterium]
MKNTLRIILALSLTLIMVFSFAACGKNDKDSSEKETTIASDESNATTDESSKAGENSQSSSGDLVKAEIVIKDYGTIKLDLYADEAPITVANFVSLAKSGFYNGLTFHRIMADFMMQGGDPLGNGTGGSDEDIEGEFSANGHQNNISHIRGTIAMARSGSGYEQYLSMGYTLADLPADAQSDLKRAYNSGSSQFFIVHKDSTFLDGNYAAFGRVTDGMDVVDKVCENAKPTDDNGTIPKGEQPVIETIKIVE